MALAIPSNIASEARKIKGLGDPASSLEGHNRSCASISRVADYTHAFVGFLPCRFLRSACARASPRAPPAADDQHFRATVDDRGGFMQPVSTTVKLAAVAMTAASAIGLGFSAAAQEVRPPFTADQCRTAQAVIYELLGKYSGRMSAELARSLGAFSKSNCDMTTTFEHRPGQDDNAFGEFNLRMVAIRKQQLSSLAPR